MPVSSASRPQGTPQGTVSDRAVPALNDLPILDPRPLNDLVQLGGSSELVQELIALFEEDVPVRLAILKTALAASDLSQTLMEAHQLKGALSNMGLVRFTELASQIESQAREGKLDREAGMTDEALSAAFEEALRALKMAYPKA